MGHKRPKRAHERVNEYRITSVELDEFVDLNDVPERVPGPNYSQYSTCHGLLANRHGG